MRISFDNIKYTNLITLNNNKKTVSYRSLQNKNTIEPENNEVKKYSIKKDTIQLVKKRWYNKQK